MLAAAVHHDRVEIKCQLVPTAANAGSGFDVCCTVAGRQLADPAVRRIVCVVDASGSMANALPLVHASLRKVLQYVEAGTELSVVTFGSTVEIALPMQAIRSDRLPDLPPFRDLGGTALRLGLNEGLKQLHAGAAPDSSLTLLLFTDGQPSDRSTADQLSALVLEHRAAHRAPSTFQLVTFGFTNDYDAALLTALGQAGRTQAAQLPVHQHINDEKDIQHLAAFIVWLQDVAARSVSVTVQLGSNTTAFVGNAPASDAQWATQSRLVTDVCNSKPVVRCLPREGTRLAVVDPQRSCTVTVDVSVGDRWRRSMQLRIAPADMSAFGFGAVSAAAGARQRAERAVNDLARLCDRVSSTLSRTAVELLRNCSPDRREASRHQLQCLHDEIEVIHRNHDCSGLNLQCRLLLCNLNDAMKRDGGYIWEPRFNPTGAGPMLSIATSHAHALLAPQTGQTYATDKQRGVMETAQLIYKMSGMDQKAIAGAGNLARELMARRAKQ